MRQSSNEEGVLEATGVTCHALQTPGRTKLSRKRQRAVRPLRHRRGSGPEGKFPGGEQRWVVGQTAWLVLVLVFAACLAAPAVSHAGDDPECTTVKLVNGKREITCKPVPIVGKGIPGALIIPRQKVEIPSKDLDERMAPKIIEETKKEPF